MCVIQGNGLEKRKLKVSGAVKANGLLPFSNRSLLFYQQDRRKLSPWTVSRRKVTFHFGQSSSLLAVYEGQLTSWLKPIVPLGLFLRSSRRQEVASLKRLNQNYSE